jgi:hypothetical protein
MCQMSENVGASTSRNPKGLHGLYRENFTLPLIKLINSFLSQRKFTVPVEGELSTPREIPAGVPHGSVLSPTLYSLCINDMPQTPGVYLGLSADDTCMYATDSKRVMFSESCSEVSVLLRSGVCDVTWKSIKIRPKPSTFLIDLGPPRLILQWMDGIPLCQSCKISRCNLR